MKIILYAIPGFIFLILVEWLYGLARDRNSYRLADTITSISLGSISRLRGLIFLGFGACNRVSAATPCPVLPGLFGRHSVACRHKFTQIFSELQ